MPYRSPSDPHGSAEKIIFHFILILIIAVSAAAQDQAQDDRGYKMPPDEIAALIDAPPTPAVSVGPDAAWMVILERPNYPSIEEFIKPELRLAGLRFNPVTNKRSRTRFSIDIKIKNISDSEEKHVDGLPENAHIENVSWSPDGSLIAFTNTTDVGVELWVAKIKSARAERIGRFYLNASYRSPFYWHPGSRMLICRTIPADRGEAPPAPTVPVGPIIQESGGEAAPAATYADLLRNSHDEELLEYYLQAQTALVTLTGETHNIGWRGMIVRTEPSPDGDYILVETIHRPFSYLVPVYRFPRRVEIWNTDGEVIRIVHDQPLAENIPCVRDAVRTGPRDFEWRSDVGAMLYYAEALDKGDPRIEALARDQIYTLTAPFKGNPIPLYATGLRYSYIIWSSDDLALVSERWGKTRKRKIWAFAPGNARVEPELVLDYSWEDRYNHPGTPVTHRNEAGQNVLLLNKKGTAIFLKGRGGSPEGDRPFLDLYDLVSKNKVRVWRSEAPFYESIFRIIDPAKPEVLTWRESITEPPNVYHRRIDKGELKQITAFSNPTPQLDEVQKEQIRYEREDGLPLTAYLYLPAGYSTDDGPLPTLIWAYPYEFKSADAAGQVFDSPYRFTRVGWWSPIIWVTRGYAVIDDAAMPIVGEGETEPNDSFVEQLTTNAAAVVEAIVQKGVADRERIAVGGHSYGAFMAANLLAHTDLFRAGLVRSGAYNRTLTPFGFQNEDRTYWEAPEIYYNMSPFMHVDDIDEPILLVHGEADSNSGTYPMQSRRFFNALKGHGATARLVMLPNESHGYRARESIMHVLWETEQWLEKYVKNAPPRETATMDDAEE